MGKRILNFTNVDNKYIFECDKKFIFEFYIDCINSNCNKLLIFGCNKFDVMDNNVLVKSATKIN